MLGVKDAAVDPVCGMTVSTNEALDRQYQGDTYYFCSQGCAGKFDEDPAGTIARRAEKEAVGKFDAGEHAGCAISSHPGSESTTGHARSSGQGTLYTCPMHPEIEQVGPGACP